jgi:tetratricopeptide (TPR) repeat protein
MRWLALGSFACVLATSVLAIADTPPSAWDRARDPAAIERYELHVHVRELLDPTALWPQPLAMGKLESARAALESASAATSPDARLRFDLGEVYERLGSHEEALAVLGPALAMAPNDGGAAGAWLAYAFAAAKLDRSREEIRGYDAALAASLEDRPDILSNRAEAEMRLGNLDAAVAGYRDVIYRMEHAAVAHRSDESIRVLARWGLAVALDRDGDPTAAEEVAAIAMEEDPREASSGDHENVFFVPAYERDWYYALGRTEKAKRETDPRRALGAWDLVVRTWADYVKSAAKGDRWLPLARTHLASAEARKLAAAARVTGATPRAPLRESSSPSEAH